MTAARIRRLMLTNFRSYHAAQVDVGAGSVALTGANGVGKTNLLEAISLLAPGRGLRRATLDEVAFTEGDGSWAISAAIEGRLVLPSLAPVSMRRVRTARRHPASAGSIASPCRLRLPSRITCACSGWSRQWTACSMVRLPSGADFSIGSCSPSMRSMRAVFRRWNAHCARAIGCSSSRAPTRTGSMPSSVKPRNSRLRFAALRAETVGRLQAVLAARSDAAAPFPAAEIALEGWMEKLLPHHPAVEVEDRYRQVLKENRARDAAAGRTLDGAHLTDLSVVYAAKNIPAADASTGEQKALLIGLVLAHAVLLTDMTGCAPVLLLDEVVAHLDPARRRALYGEFERLGAQVWMTGADPVPFNEISSSTELFEVASGRLERQR